MFHSSLLSLFVSYEENAVLRKYFQELYSQQYLFRNSFKNRPSRLEYLLLTGLYSLV